MAKLEKGAGLKIFLSGVFLGWNKSAEKFTLSYFDVILLHVIS